MGKGASVTQPPWAVSRALSALAPATAAFGNLTRGKQVDTIGIGPEGKNNA